MLLTTLKETGDSGDVTGAGLIRNIRRFQAYSQGCGGQGPSAEGTQFERGRAVGRGLGNGWMWVGFVGVGGGIGSVWYFSFLGCCGPFPPGVRAKVLGDAFVGSNKFVCPSD